MNENKEEKSEVVRKEEEILEFWQKNRIFKKTIDKPNPNGNFVFFDGPPFATGLPHYGHILPGTIKDIIPRFQTMKGKRVLRKWGWDCHGLPVENIVEKELGLQSKKDIEVYGVDKFNEASRAVVFRYADEWKKIIPRTGRWVDMENSYRTIDPTYTESVWWAFGTLYDKGLVYKGFKSMNLCPRCETTLSNFEVNQGYKDITDISVTVEFPIVGEENTSILAWTTTPWTLPGNVALAVGPEIEYVCIEKKDEGVGKTVRFILAKEALSKAFKNDDYKIVKTYHGKDLVGLSYTPPFNYYFNDDKLKNHNNGWKLYSADFVTTTDGTGIVHIAPAFGDDDMKLGKENNLPFIQHVKTDGTFKSEVTDFAGLHVKPIEDVQKTDVEIIKYLAKQGTLFAKEKIIHSYPHCWRCSTPLLNYATTSWFIKVTALKDRLVELNKTISWTPEDIGEGRFGKWLEGARDWAVSRSRYWGAPLPVWQSDSGEQVVIKSIAELKDRIGRRNTFLTLRHGESEYNAEGNRINCIQTEENPLTEIGRNQVIASAHNTKQNIDVIIASPFSRTKETAEIFAREIGFDASKIIFDDRLREIYVPSHEGKSWESFTALFASVRDRFERSIEGSETWSQASERVMGFLYDINQKYEGKNILIVGHGGPLNLMLLASKGYSNEEIIKNYCNEVKNGVVDHCDFVALPHNSHYEVDLHRPHIDEVTFTNEKGEVFRRIPEVFDCWLESGSMPFAQNHYPFDKKELFDSGESPLFPADFISEGLDQTRGWFYTLLVMSTALFDRVPYKHVVVNGLVLAEDGRKMSKSLKNFPDPMDVINKYGADALRFYLINSPLVKAGDANFSEKGVDEVSKKIIQKIYNILALYEMYASGGQGVPEKTVLDEWIISRLNQTIETVTTSLEKYELDRATRPIVDFVDDLSVWYIRRSRERFKSNDEVTAWTVTYYTRYVLMELAKTLAPFMPFLAEVVYQRLSGSKESVHLEDWPQVTNINTDLVAQITLLRETVTKALELRQKSGIKVRQPLASLTIPQSFSDDLQAILADEINVKRIVVSSDAPLSLDTNITPELKDEGIARDIIRFVQDVRKTENLAPSDVVTATFSAPDEIAQIITAYADMIQAPTNIRSIVFSPETGAHTTEIDGTTLSVTLGK